MLYVLLIYEFCSYTNNNNNNKLVTLDRNGS